MADVTLKNADLIKTASRDRAAALKALKLGDVVFENITRASAIAVLLILSGVIVSLVAGSIPAFRAFGVGFFTSAVWNPVTEKFGAVAAISGTITTSIIAMVIAVPIGLGVAIFLTELCPQGLRRPIGIAIELLAGIPSIIYGIWGLFVFAPFVQQYVEPPIIALVRAAPGSLVRYSRVRPTESAC